MTAREQFPILAALAAFGEPAPPGIDYSVAVAAAPATLEAIAALDLIDELRGEAP